jgi:integrase
MPLSPTQISNTKPTDRLQKLADGGGLYLAVFPTGGKSWRFKYRYGGKEKLLTFGQWPAMSLAAARKKRDEARRLLAEGIDPGAERQAERARREALASNTFEAVAREWIERHLSKKSQAYRERVVSQLERFVFPVIGERPIAELTAPDILEVVRRVEKLNILETAHRVRQVVGQVIRYAIATGRAQADPTPALRGALPPAPTRHMAAPDDPAKVGEILRALEAFQGTPVVAAAIRLLPYVFVRPGELRTMRWADVDLEAAEWRFEASKTRTPHVVPLSRQALAILRDLKPLTGHLPGGWVFPNERTSLRPMSDMAVNAALRRLGISTRDELTGHGWRAVARTLLHERLGYPAEVIEHQLAHAVPDALGRAYNRTRFLEMRREMMQRWADYLDKLRDGAEVVPLRRAR